MQSENNTEQKEKTTQSGQPTQTEKPIWKVLTLLATLLGIGATIFVHYASENTVKEEIVNTLAAQYDYVDAEMSYQQALGALDTDIKTLRAENVDLYVKDVKAQAKIADLEAGNTELETKISELLEAVKTTPTPAPTPKPTPMPTLAPTPEPTPETPSLITLRSIPVHKNNSVDGWGIGHTDNWGNKYMSGLIFTHYDDYIIYVLDSKYTSLTMTFTPCNNEGGLGKFAFYSVLDIGTTKLCEIDEISATTKPFTETIDVSGIDMLMITKTSGNVDNAIVDAYLE